MNKWFLVTTLALSVAACSKDKPAESPEGMTTPATSEARTAGGSNVESIRMTLLREYPHRADEIRALAISEDGGIVTLSGTVNDEPTRSQLASRVRQMSGVRDVQDRMRTQQQIGMGQTGAQQPTSAATVDEVRMFLLQERPNDSDIVRGLVISEDGGIVTLRGRVYDEQMKSDLTRAARNARGVRDVKDNMQVDQSLKGKGGGGGGKSDDGSTQMGTGAESVRATLLRERPNQADVVNSLTITEQGDVILIRGTVPDEKTKKQIVDSAKKAAGNKKVRDDLEVKKK